MKKQAKQNGLYLSVPNNADGILVETFLNEYFPSGGNRSGLSAMVFRLAAIGLRTIGYNRASKQAGENRTEQFSNPVGRQSNQSNSEPKISVIKKSEKSDEHVKQIEQAKPVQSPVSNDVGFDAIAQSLIAELEGKE